MSDQVEHSEERHRNEIEFLKKMNEALKPVESEINKETSPLELKYENGKSSLRVSQVSPVLMGKIKKYLLDAGLILDKDIASDSMEEEFELPVPPDEPQA